ncbi:DoxX family protein [Marivirga arenosa]|uniref:DoxX family protein n=1 Tax=Marivirga arenosa TaxID=3059076 RepID=A0AA49GEU5_9BACT|nr:DoxX family protein [Marivirga sp. ABR2-2]WKK85091.1 DoxX family protein [Marivirga sp. ABR2-2]
MNNLSKIDQFYLEVKSNRWYWLFSIFCRLALSYAFIVAGIVKIVGERFASGLSVIHPMGAYLEALHQTGFYYTFIGYAQVIAAILLLIPRTVLLGALIYLPIILNIMVLSIAVRFEGSFITSPLMVLANLYILAWHYDKLRFILPFKNFVKYPEKLKPLKYNNSFPYIFFSIVFLSVAITIIVFLKGFELMPRNSLKDCKKQFENTDNEKKGFEFCECIHVKGNSLNECIDNYETLNTY